MRKRAAVAAASILGLVVLFGGPSPLPAQAPPGDINPPVADCNLTPDTNEASVPAPGQPTATPITTALLTSGQPCQQVVSERGLFGDDQLANLQRGFDFYSWLTFIAMNSPADGKTIGQGPRPGGDALTKWEDLANFRPLADVMLPKGAQPTWGTPPVPDACKALDGPGKIVFTVVEEAFDQPFRTGPLIAQDGHFALFDILMNWPMFDYILVNGLYSKQGQEKFAGTVAFPEGVNPGEDKQKRPTPGRMGAIMVKVAWRVLDPDKDKGLMGRFHTADALIYFPGPPDTKTGPTCAAKTLALVGFHVGHKTRGAPQWVWSTFEYVDNAPDAADVHARRSYNFFDAACADCPANETPPQPWDPDASLKFPAAYASQVVRTKMLPRDVLDEVAQLNQAFRAILKGTVWENYMLIATQWPTDSTNKIDPTGVPAPTYLANTTLETYSQGRIPLASSSCMACHNNATTQHVPATSSDFTFILEKARCEDGKCPASEGARR
ncbi:MAG TPA: hypothetical protein VEK73_23165 [Xanthobacteraceae bacterium]|nr:hypothetical protein [Xanthobacteraceae bacterium]